MGVLSGNYFRYSAFHDDKLKLTGSVPGMMWIIFLPGAKKIGNGTGLKKRIISLIMYDNCNM